MVMLHSAHSYLFIYPDELGIADHESRVINKFNLKHHAVSDLLAVLY